MSRHNPHRTRTRQVLRRPFRNRNRRCLRGRRHGPDDLTQALTAFGRALRAHRRLARLAPSFFDAAVVDREAENRAAVNRWMATWEPALAKAYGVEPGPPADTVSLPPLPSPRIQRKVELKLAERSLCLAAGRAAMERYQQRQPHAVMSFSRMARLVEIGLNFGKLALGLDSPNPLPEKIEYDYELTNLKRSYGCEPEPPAMDQVDSAPIAPASASSPQVAPVGSLAPGSPPVSATGTVPAKSDPANVVTVPAAATPPAPSVPPRCDAWSRWAKNLRRMRS